MSWILVQRLRWIPVAVFVRGRSQQGWGTWRKLCDIPGARKLAEWAMR